MILSYTARLICVSLAVGMMVHTLLGLAVGPIAAMVMRWAERMRPRNGARLLLGMRLLPAAGALFVVAAFCIPSYLFLEQEAGGEEIGVLCLGVAFTAAVLAVNSAINLGQAMARSARYARHCERSGAPVLMLAGILRPRLVVSETIRRALSPEQLDAALRHEQAHRRAFDNFKRMLLAATPRMPGFAVIEQTWSRLSEWAADDEAVAGDANRALNLADALVRVARLGTRPVEVSFLGDGRDLARRVERLLNPEVYIPLQMRVWTVASAAGIAAMAIAVLVAQPLVAAHEVLEHLIH
jgi:hypothetical protein